jgi:hypothetical protein
MSFRKPLHSLTIVALIFCLASAGVLAMKLLPQQPAPQQGGPLTPPPKPIPEKSGPISSVTGAGGPLTVGERLNFNVSWAGFVTAARLELEVMDRGAFFGQEGFQLRTRVETVGYARSLLADVDNQYNSYVDAKSLLPFRVENSTRQGGKKSEELLVFDQAGNSVRYSDGSELAVPRNISDLPSMLQALRFRDLKSGTIHKFPVLFGKTISEVDAVAKTTERVITQAGAYDAIRVEFNIKSPTASVNKLRVRAWFSNDPQRMPLLVTALTPFGEMRAELSSAIVSDKPRTDIGRAAQNNSPLLASTAPPPPGAVFEAITFGEVQPDNYPFPMGERLNYDISWGNFASVGKASFSVRRQGKLGARRVYEFVSEVASTGAARAVLSINDIFTSYVDAEKLLPVRTDLRLREGSRIKDITADYNQSANSVLLSNGSSFSVKAKTLDLVSLFYAVRAADLKPGSVHPFDFLDANHRPKSLIFRVAKQETIGGPLGPQDTLQLDVLKAENQQLIAQVWLTNDARRLPLYLAVRLRIGELRFQLASLSGAR